MLIATIICVGLIVLYCKMYDIDFNAKVITLGTEIIRLINAVIPL